MQSWMECKYQCNTVLLVLQAFFKQDITVNGIHFPNFWPNNFGSYNPYQLTKILNHLISVVDLLHQNIYVLFWLVVQKV